MIKSVNWIIQQAQKTKEAGLFEGKRRPIHPGILLKKQYLEPLNISPESLAQSLGVPPRILNALINGQAAITPDIAMRLSRIFNTSSYMWLNLQENFDRYY